MQTRRRPGRVIPVVLILSTLLSAACGLSITDSPQISKASPTSWSLPASRTPFQPVTLTPINPSTGSPEVVETAVIETQATPPVAFPATASSTPTPLETSGAPIASGQPFSLWVAPYLPANLVDSLSLPPGAGEASPDQASVRLEVGDQRLVSRWIYALAAPFPTMPDGVSSQDLRRSWKGEPAGPLAGQPLLVDESTYGVFAAWWGEPGPGATMVLPAGELAGYAWDHRPSWALLPFESLEPGWKALEVDGRSPLRKEFDPGDYALTVPVSLNGDPNIVNELLDLDGIAASLGIPPTNRDPDRLTTLAMTGVTALVRATAFTMRRNGLTYPAQDIGDLLSSADLTHISNEIPFTPDCPPPNPTQTGLVFCSDPSYIELLEAVGTDIVELTDDHFGDWGPEAMLFTLGLYEQRNWVYYGGGYDRADARQARLIEHNGNRLAFIGCNAKGGGYATASETQPGAVACDYAWMHDEISRLREEGYTVISTFQHFEYYTYAAQPDQIEDFRGMSAAGAVIVSGSQAHQPQGMEFYNGSFIHYGLGNLFFDQYNYCTDYACNDGFIDRHVFYNGKYISTELFPIQFIDYARPRLMTPEEKSGLLEKVFSASGW